MFTKHIQEFPIPNGVQRSVAYDPAYTTCTKIEPNDDSTPVDKPSPNDNPSPDDDASQYDHQSQDDYSFLDDDSSPADNQAPADDPAANAQDEIQKKIRHHRTEGTKCRETLGQIKNLTYVAEGWQDGEVLSKLRVKLNECYELLMQSTPKAKGTILEVPPSKKIIRKKSPKI